MAANESGHSFSKISRVFSENSSSYKFYWFWSILRLLKQRHLNGDFSRCIPVRDLLIEMVVCSFHTVGFFRLTFGHSDKLERISRDLVDLYSVPPTINHAALRDFVSNCSGIGCGLKDLAIYVPALFLSPWFEHELRGISAGTDRARRATELSYARRRRRGAAPYWICSSEGGKFIEIAPDWHDYLAANMRILEAFVQFSLCRYLQDKNPGIPSIVEKLEVPQSRRLARARSLWNHVRAASPVNGGGSHYEIFDIYSAAPLSDRYSIDHFLPWSFVAHDQIWNLAPVLTTTNSAKGNALPDIEQYLPSFVDLHWKVLNLIQNRPKEQIEYAMAFRKNYECLISDGRDNLFSLYQRLIIPQVQIARNYGFRCDWQF